MIELFNKSVLIFILILFSSQYLFAQESLNMEQSKKSPFVLKITYKNPYKTTRNIVKLGIKVDGIENFYLACVMDFPHFRHAYGENNSYYSDFLQFPADYVINFHVSNDETIINVFPPIELKPDEAKSFTISFYPSLRGGCTSTLSFEVSGILIFDDGREEYTKNKYRITANDVYKFEENKPEKDEFMEAINNRNIIIRRRAYSQLHKAPFNKEELKFLIKRGLEDQDAGTRAVSALSASKLGFTDYANKINSHLKNSLNKLDAQAKLYREYRNKFKQMFDAPPSSVIAKPPQVRLAEESVYQKLRELEPKDKLLMEIADYCSALGEMQDAANIDILISALLNTNFAYPDKASDALIKLSHPDVVEKLRPFFFENIKWLAADDDYDLSERYIEIYKIIIAYRDVKSVDFLLDITNKSDALLDLLADEIKKTTKENQIIREPFILRLRPAFEKALRVLDFYDDRFDALEILSRMQIDDAIIQGYFKIMFKDEASQNKREAAKLAAELGYKSLAGDILLLLKSSDSEYEKKDYCEALKKLEVPCK